MDKVNIVNVLIQDKPSDKNSNYYDLQMKFELLIVKNKITFSFGDKDAGASFNYDSNNYCIENGAYFEISNCIFKDNVEVAIDNPTNNIKWINCIFEKDLIIKSSQSVEKMHKISSFILEGGEINNLIIDNITANFKFYINPQEKKYKSSIKITNLKINDSKFIENFKLHHAIVHKVEIEDVDFEQNADFFKSTFKEGTIEEDVDEKTKKGDIGFKAINFKKLALFGDTEFHKKLIFKYVTFEGHNHFKSAKLHKGLDLEYTNVQKEINFYGIEILDKTTTSQETYRIIKNQFEKLNNKIEANKYHALELEQRRKELEENKSSDWREKWVFRIHDWSSEHSTNWFRALLWIIFVSFLTIFLVHFEIVKDLFFHPYHFKIEYIFKICNEFWQYINITNLEKLKDKPFIFFLNKVSLGYLYYQFLTAVRKDTRK
ncbi:MAG: hypothetical protein Q8N78_10870 [Sulfurimonas sp.]|nr:hypothetical protein [Sulfurimonas sp.]